MEFHHAALRNFLKKLLDIEHLSDGLEVEIPNIGKSYLHVRLEFLVGDIKEQNPMACHFNGFSSNIAYIVQHPQPILSTNFGVNLLINSKWIR
jgi:hypothetical protein